MKSLMLLWQSLAAECGEECCVCTVRDGKTVTDRYEHEGLAFLAYTLPNFCRDFERGLAQEAIGRSSFQGFTWRGGLPAFLGGFLDRVFCRSTGRLLDDPDVNAIRSIRQLCLLFGKVEAPVSDKRRLIAIEGYVECEEEVKRSELSWSDPVLSEFDQVSHLLFGEVLSGVNNKLYREHNGWDRNDPDWPYIHPRHGPGATADRLSGNAKFDLTEWPLRLERVFPFGDYALPNWRYSYRLSRVDFLEPGLERAAKLVSVPKTIMKPRLIAKEPTALQYMQQGVSGLLVKSIQRDPFVGKMIGFDDQPNNHRLCQRGSLSGEFATLDLSEASDRVSNQLVLRLLKPGSLITEAAQAVRSGTVDVPGHGVIAVAKYASMGSALTFPIEAMVFLTAVFVGISRALNRPLRRSDVKSLSSQVRVYGDDIIVPVGYTHEVIRSLEGFGLKVNANKSFWTGKFRESCGREYYSGVDVSVVRVRHLSTTPGGEWSLPLSLESALQVESLVALRNRFFISGWWQTARWLDSWIRPLLGGVYPTSLAQLVSSEGEIGSRSDGLCRWSFAGYQTDVISVHTQAPMVRCWKRIQDIPESHLRDEGALLKVLSHRGLDPLAVDHLEHAGRPTSSALKRRMTSPV